MSVLKNLILAAAIIILSGAILWHAVFNEDNDLEYSWRYKLTVEVETPEGVKTGSAVREVTVQFYPTGNKHPHDRKYNSSKFVKGEAVVVDLGERGVVFATLRGYSSDRGYALSMPFQIFSSPSPGGTIDGAKYYSQLDKHAEITEPAYFPVFVTFIDLNDPKTIKGLMEVNVVNRYPPRYEIKKSHFEDYFGKGVRLKSVSIEMTDEPVTDELRDYLKWIDTKKMGLRSADPAVKDPVKYFINRDMSVRMKK